MMQDFPVSTRVEVRWRDVDALGHVNNAVYFTYLEIARTVYLERVFDVRRLGEIPILLASARCDFLSPVTHGEVVEVGIRIPSVGRTSFDFEYELRASPGARLVARASTTQVLYDHAAGHKLAVTEPWLDRVEAAEGRRPERRARQTTGG